MSGTPYESPAAPLGTIQESETLHIRSFEDVLRASERAAELDARRALPFTQPRRSRWDIGKFHEGMKIEMGEISMHTIQCTQRQAGALCSYLFRAAGVREFFMYPLLTEMRPRQELFALLNSLDPFQGPEQKLHRSEGPSAVTLDIVREDSCSAQLVRGLQYPLSDEISVNVPNEQDEPAGSVEDLMTGHIDKYLPLRNISGRERELRAQRRRRLGAALRACLDLLPISVRHTKVKDEFEKAIATLCGTLERERRSPAFKGKREPNYFLCIMDATVKLLQQHKYFKEE